MRNIDVVVESLVSTKVATNVLGGLWRFQLVTQDSIVADTIDSPSANATFLNVSPGVFTIRGVRLDSLGNPLGVANDSVAFTVEADAKFVDTVGFLKVTLV